MANEDLHKYCLTYLKETGLEFNNVPSWIDVGEIIQKDFEQFAQYVKSKQ